MVPVSLEEAPLPMLLPVPMPLELLPMPVLPLPGVVRLAAPPGLSALTDGSSAAALGSRTSDAPLPAGMPLGVVAGLVLGAGLVLVWANAHPAVAMTCMVRPT